jgi:Domain of unknown function (DUF4328)
VTSLDPTENPYAAPTYQPPTRQLPTDETEAHEWRREFKFNNRINCTITCVLIGAGILLCCVSLLSSYMQLLLLQGPSFDSITAESNDAREQIIGFIAIGLYLVTAIFFSIWTVRAHHNVRHFGTRRLTITPGWAIGYFFIPIFNLFRPYTAMSELRRASEMPQDWMERSSGIVPLWWTLWIVHAILGRVVNAYARSAQDIQAFIELTWMQITTEILYIPLAIVAILMLRDIQSQQESWVDGLG